MNKDFRNSETGVSLLHYLDIDPYSFLEDPDSENGKTKLKKEYHLDGTHLNPSYLSLLQSALENACARCDNKTK